MTVTAISQTTLPPGKWTDLTVQSDDTIVVCGPQGLLRVIQAVVQEMPMPGFQPIGIESHNDILFFTCSHNGGQFLCKLINDGSVEQLIGRKKLRRG